MSPEEFTEAARACTHNLGHYRRTVRERIQEIADSPHCEHRADHYGAGGFVGLLEQEIAGLLGKEAAVFMPSGTMAQQIALRIWADRSGNNAVAFHPMCHLHTHEHMAYEKLHHLEAIILGEPDRLFTLQDLQGIERPISSLLIEFPQRDIGGQLPTWEEFQAIVNHAEETNVKLHLDGARFWECAPYYNRTYEEMAAPFDSVYVSFYKILAGLPGAALAGPADFIAEARIWMRRHGGNLDNMASNAISAKIGMDLRLPRIPAYVAKANEVASIVNRLDGVTVVPSTPPTNMMHVYFSSSKDNVMAASGHIARENKCLLVPYVQDTERGRLSELWIGDAGLDIPTERIESLFAEMLQVAAASGP